MMELLIKVLIALGSLSTPADFNEEYESTHSAKVNEVKSLIDQGRVQESSGGVIVDGVVI